MEATKIKKYSIAEYLEFEKTAVEKHEYYGGEIFAMSGGTYNHSLITSNISGSLRNALREKGKKCRVLSSDMRIALDFATAFVYPDVSVVCDKPKFSPLDKNSLTNPILIVEVLSKGTRGYDRGEKFLKYKHLPSFTEYVVIEQREPLVEVASRQQDGSWNTVTTIGLDKSINLISLACKLSMVDIYEGIENLGEASLRLFIGE